VGGVSVAVRDELTGTARQPELPPAVAGHTVHLHMGLSVFTGGSYRLDTISKVTSVLDL